MKIAVSIQLIVSLVLCTGCYDLGAGSAVTVLEDNYIDPGNLVADPEEKNRESVFWNTCDPAAAWFDGMKSGDNCVDSCTQLGTDTCVGNGCGYKNDPVSADIHSARSVSCIDDVIAATNGFPLYDAAPRADVTWTDCTASADGRNLEACSGNFSCYTPAADGCLTVVTCRNDIASTTGSSLLRYRMCDDALAPSGAIEGDIPSDCQAYENTSPLDVCAGSFLCHGNMWNDPPAQLSEVPPCSTTSGYCIEGTPTDDKSHIVWCNDGRIHILWNLDHYMTRDLP